MLLLLSLQNRIFLGIWGHLEVPQLVRGEAKHRAGVNDGGACHGHIGGHVLHAGVGAAGPPVVAHGVPVVEGITRLRQCGPAVEVKRLL